MIVKSAHVYDTELDYVKGVLAGAGGLDRDDDKHESRVGQDGYEPGGRERDPRETPTDAACRPGQRQIIAPPVSLRRLCNPDDAPAG
jgi:hypothetical protein